MAGRQGYGMNCVAGRTVGIQMAVGCSLNVGIINYSEGSPTFIIVQNVLKELIIGKYIEDNVKTHKKKRREV